MNRLGEFLESIRKERKLTLREVSALSGLSYTYIRDVELGTNRKTGKEVTPSALTLKKLATALKIEYYTLLEKSGIVDEDVLSDANTKVADLIRETTNSYSFNSVPLIGTICAGQGVIAKEDIEGYVSYPMPNKVLPDFALRVSGNSMIGADIKDGDIVYFRSAKWAEKNGQIVAVIINGEEGTLKRMFWDAASPKVKLVPENSEFDVLEVLPSEIHVCGLYCGHFRMGDE